MVARWGVLSHTRDDLDREITVANCILDGLKSRFDNVDKLPDVKEQFKELKILSEESLRLQNYFAEKHLRADRKIGELLTELRKESPEFYQLITTALRKGPEFLQKIIDLCKEREEELSKKGVTA